MNAAADDDILHSTAMTEGFGFRVLAGNPAGARRGELRTPHGHVDTPAFMPVATQGAVKGVTSDQLRSTGAQIVLANAYHLTLRPGPEAVAALGGLHSFMNWPRPILTDSGGFQVLSLADLRSIDDDGVRFRSHLDGQPLDLTPERVMEIAVHLAPDIAMVLDHCPPPNVGRDEAARAMERTVAWAERSARAREALRPTGPLAVFAIGQGGAYEDLREEGAERIARLPFDGFAVGGVSVGEDRERLLATIPWGTRHLPPDRPRYLMGVGGFQEFVHAIEAGVDLFDCVLPTRNARNGHLIRRDGAVIRLKNSRYARDPEPVDSDCDCATCAHYSRGFLHHLVLRKEMVGSTLVSIHNLRVFHRFLEDARQAIQGGTWREFHRRWA